MTKVRGGGKTGNTHRQQSRVKGMTDISFSMSSIISHCLGYFIVRTIFYCKENVILFNPEITINIINNNNYFMDGVNDSEKELEKERIKKLAELNKRCKEFNKQTLEFFLPLLK